MPQNNNPSGSPSSPSGSPSTGTTVGAKPTGDAGVKHDAGTSLTHGAPTVPAPTPASEASQGIGAQAQQYGQKVADAATQAKDYVADKMSVVGDKFKDLQNKDINQVAEEAKQYARQNPGQAILISAAAGLILGLLFRGSRR
ncbi:MAG: hypothetical protein WKF30_01095 [Pyrinomonadaceae bacterium]